MARPSHDTGNFLDSIQIGLGAWAWGDRVVWQFGREYGAAEVRGAFQTAVANGIRLVDTAEVYGSGRSERLVGEFMRDMAATVKVATKFFPWPWRLNSKSVPNALRASLRRLGLNQVDLYQIHSPAAAMEAEAVAEGLVECVESGLARAVGVCNFSESQMLRVYSTLTRHNVPLVSNQVHFSLLHRQAEKNGLLGRCRELNVRLIACSPLEMGLLTGKYGRSQPPTGTRALRYAVLLGRIQQLLRLLTEIGQDQGGKSNAQVALNWLVAKGALPVPGAKTGDQVAKNLGALGWSLTSDQVASLDAASDRVLGGHGDD